MTPSLRTLPLLAALSGLLGAGTGYAQGTGCTPEMVKAGICRIVLCDQATGDCRDWSDKGVSFGIGKPMSTGAPVILSDQAR